MDKKKIRSIRGLILFAAVVVLAIIYSKESMMMITLLLMFLKPFIIGGAIAFVINILMKKVEKFLFSKAKGKIAIHVKRPLSILISVILLVGIIVIVCLTVLPQVGRTIAEIGKQIPIFMEEMFQWLEKKLGDYPELMEELYQLEKIEFNWEEIFSSVVSFMKNGLGSVINSTVSMASSIVGAVVNVVVAFIFAFYLLSQKERLGNQCERALRAYCKESVYLWVKKVSHLLNRNFSNFITGQCLEAVILGSLFVVTMAIFQFPYALLIGVLIAFLALIPIVGAFVGCTVGVFLIFMDDPIKAFWFLILFLIIQQIEGNLIYPHVVGNSVGLPSIWVLVAVTVGGSMMGILGMLLFIPLTSTSYLLVKEDVNRRNLLKDSIASDKVKKEKKKNEPSSKSKL